MTGNGVNDAPALKKANIGIAVAAARDSACSASNIVLTEPGLGVIISAVLINRAIFQRMKNNTIYVVSVTIRIVLGFTLLALRWKFDFPPFMVLIIAILNDGAICATLLWLMLGCVNSNAWAEAWMTQLLFTLSDVVVL